MPNQNDFDHYTESAEEMNKISKFFDRFFIFNIIKNAVNFLFIPTILNLYTINEISLHLLFIISGIILSLFMSYKQNYLKNPRKCKLCAELFIILETLSVIFKFGFNLSIIESLLNILSYISIGLAGKSIKKYLNLEKLSNLKGYPFFNELLDNPNYVAPLNIPVSPQKSIVSVTIPPIKSHVSVKIPDLQPEPIIAPMTAEPIQKFSQDIMIMPSYDTPAEARILGNATMDYTEYVKLNDLYDNQQQSRKKINLSKTKPPNLDEI